MMTMQSTVGATRYDSLRSVSAEALLQQLRSDVPLTILDVREPAQVRATRSIAGARMLPLRELAGRFTELAHLRTTPIVVVSQTACRARTAALELGMAGFEEVFVLDGGMQRWLELGYPVCGNGARIALR